MYQVTARVVDRQEVLPALVRAGCRSLMGSHIIWLECPEIALSAIPGQFVMVKCGRECTMARPFSIHAVSRESIAIYFNVLEEGRGTHWLAERKTGEKIELYGPLGNGFTIDTNAFNLLLIAGGAGIAPLRFLCQEAQRGGRTVTLLMGAQAKNQLYPEKMLPSGINQLIVATEDGSAGKKGLVTHLLPGHIEKADQVFACGPVPMYRTMFASNRELLKDKQAQVSLEVRMGCGLGICYSCTVKTRQGLKQVCKDGPVFMLDEVLWDELRC